MKYYGDITFKLQFVLVRRWVEHNWFARVICRLIGSPICAKLPYPNLIEELTRIKI